MNSPKRLAATSLTVFSLLLVSSFAWACTVQARILAISTLSGPAGSPVTIRGEAIAPEGGVEVLWEGTKGRQLGAAIADDRGNFSITVTIPQAPPGVYSIVASAKGSGLARTPFEITETPSIAGPRVTADSLGGSSRTASDLWTGFAGTPGGVDGAAALASAANTPNPLVPGLVLIAAGLVGLGGVIPVVALRRRRSAIR